MISRLNEVNDVAVQSIQDEAFRPYGRVLSGYDFRELIRYMETSTEIPAEGNFYTPSVAAMEQTAVGKALQSSFYGGMPIEIGYCNGRNTTYNGFEYHKGSEINVAVTDFMLVLGHSWDIRQKTYRVEDAAVFFVPKGSAIEMYQTTLHLSPCRVTDAGFKDIVVLPRGTNTPLVGKQILEEENELLLQTNKWVIAHPNREPLIRQGAYPGLLGENKELHY